MPLERPNGVTKEFYTPEEAEAAIKRAAEREAEQTEPGTTADVHYDFTPVRAGPQPVDVREEPADVADRRSGGRQDAAGHRRRDRSGRRTAPRRERPLGGQYDAVENMPIGSRCIIMGGAGPPLMNAGYNANYQIVQAPGYVMILTEMIHDVRIIPLDGRPQPPSQRAPVGGHLARTLGRQHAGRRDHQLQRQEPVQGRQREHEGDRTVHARRRRHDHYKFTVEDPRRGTDPGPPRRRWRRPRDRSSSSPVTKATTASRTSWPALEPTRRRPPKPPEEGLELAMRMKLAVAIAVCRVAAGRRRQLRAHHAFAAEFDVNKPLKLQGHADRSGRWSIPTPGSTST